MYVYMNTWWNILFHYFFFFLPILRLKIRGFFLLFQHFLPWSTYIFIYDFPPSFVVRIFSSNVFHVIRFWRDFFSLSLSQFSFSHGR